MFYVLQRLRLHGWYRPPGEMLMIPEVYGDLRLVTPGLLDAASSLGLSVHVWTVNEPDDMRRLMTMTIDGIITDYPGRLQDILASETVSEPIAAASADRPAPGRRRPCPEERFQVAW
ncbi:MAG: glycerophosphodiester phosphodiesterase family protein [Trueperaceae bacterium]|nr:glycerophosphodiester phosphodiesterase family protein [Trueperaceae bacterium]